MTHPQEPDVGDVSVVPWTARLALSVARATDLPHDEQVDAIRTAVDDGLLPEPAVDALIADGFPELDG